MKMMKTMNKVIAVMMIMAITTAVPAMAGNKKHNTVKKETVVVVSNPDRAVSHFDRLDSKSYCLNDHKCHASRPVVKSCTFKVSHRAAHRNVVAKAERLHGVIDACWNPRTHEVTVRYDARRTSAHHIMHSMA